MTEQGRDYRRWIEAGYRHYGEDPWFFIRELAQNSRDAGASAIHIKIDYIREKEEILIFEDNGTGMSYNHGVSYLFRLYASSKTGEKKAAGMFGIGFWTILKYEPTAIFIESRWGNEKWGVMVDSELNTVRMPSDLDHHGTRITLVRRPKEQSSEAFSNRVEKAIETYCSFLRMNNADADLLPVYFKGKNKTGKMALQGRVSLNFKSKWVEGAVGLGPEPKVYLYARGLPVWEGTSLGELSHTFSSTGGKEEMEIGEGLAPVFLLNGNRLEVNISRRRVIDNKSLEEVQKFSERALMDLVERAADYVSPRNILRKLWDGLKRRLSFLGNWYVKAFIIIVLLVIPLEILLLTNLAKKNNNFGRVGDTSTLTLEVDNTFYGGASVRKTGSDTTLDLKYEPRNMTWFKLFSADEYSIKSGFFTKVNERNKLPLQTTKCNFGDKRINIEFNIKEPGRIYLPQPFGPISNETYCIDRDSVRVDGIKIENIYYLPSGDVIASVVKKGTIGYRCCYDGGRNVENNVSGDELRKLTFLPDELVLPGKIEDELRAFRQSGKGSGDAVKLALGLTTSLLKYDDSPEVIEKYRGMENWPDWLEKILAIGKGDCDILNGVTALFLRRMNIPARLVIGFVGDNGKLLRGLHAWVEYYDEGNHKQMADATMMNRGDAGSGMGERSASNDGGVGIEIGKNRYIKYGLYVLVGFLFWALLVIILRLKKQREGGVKNEETKGEVRESLGGMVLHELLHPGAWGHNRGIRNFKIIPTIWGEYISLREGLKLGGKRKLFIISKNSDIGEYLRRKRNGLVGLGRKYVILDTSDKWFARVVKLIPGGINLDKIIGLNVVEPGMGDNDDVSKLVMGVNEFLRNIDRRIRICLITKGMGAGDYLDVDLSLLPSLEKWGIRSRFIGVNLNSKRIQKLGNLYSSNRKLAVFRFIRGMVDESNIIGEPSARLLEKVSKGLWEWK